jgi:hypothetical protein
VKYPSCIEADRIAVAPGRSSGGSDSPYALETSVRPPAAKAATAKSAVLTASEERNTPKASTAAASCSASPLSQGQGFPTVKRRSAVLPATYAAAPIASSTPVAATDVRYDWTNKAPA